jgi:hypothetical protein
VDCAALPQEGLLGSVKGFMHGHKLAHGPQAAARNACQCAYDITIVLS